MHFLFSLLSTQREFPQSIILLTALYFWFSSVSVHYTNGIPNRTSEQQIKLLFCHSAALTFFFFTYSRNTPKKIITKATQWCNVIFCMIPLLPPGVRPQTCRLTGEPEILNACRCECECESVSAL